LLLTLTSPSPSDEDGRGQKFDGYLSESSGTATALKEGGYFLGKQIVHPGDKQAPEGFYRVTLRQLNPNSRHRLAFNIGYPNAYDKSQGRTGSAIMVHGGCSSVGCFAMTDAQIEEIYPIVEAALRGGQSAMDVAIFPFRMTETALQREAGSAWIEFWRNLKQGADLFDAQSRLAAVATAEGRYCFGDEAMAVGTTPITGWD